MCHNHRSDERGFVPGVQFQPNPRESQECLEFGAVTSVHVRSSICICSVEAGVHLLDCRDEQRAGWRRFEEAAGGCSALG